ncbi:MAG: hypothetical protein PVJ26_18690, partial [Anaerolineae bacterium]
MDESLAFKAPNEVAAEIDAAIRALPVQNAPSVRAVRRQYTQQLAQEDAGFVLDVARELLWTYDHRSVPYELIRYHRAAFASLGASDLEALGQGMDSWWSVDSFARTLAGPAWLRRQVSDERIH